MLGVSGACLGAEGSEVGNGFAMMFPGKGCQRILGCVWCLDGVCWCLNSIGEEEGRVKDYGWVCK